MSYQVLARKWRPDHFDEVVGQGHVAQTLINAIEQDRVAHAYLFCGARGVGKTSTARILAKAMNCKQGPTARPCYECSSCQEISRGQSVDVFEIDGASNRGINEIRELRDGVRYAPSRDAKKIYIIDEVHMLTTEAFNALLKTLEEPPPHAIFIFATTEPQKIPVTILSRCQRFDFKRISQRDIVSHLESLCEHEGINAEKAALQVIARQANGGMRDALSLLDQIISFAGDRIDEAEIAEILGVANRKHLFELSEAVLNRDAERALLVLDDVNRFGYDMHQFATELVNHFRDLMVISVVNEPEKVTQLTESELVAAREQVKGCSRELMHRYFSVMVDGAQSMSRSSFPTLIFEMTLVRLAELEPMMGLDLMVDRLRLLETTLEDDAGAEVQWPTEIASSTAPPQRASGPSARPDPTQPPEVQEREQPEKAAESEEPEKSPQPPPPKEPQEDEPGKQPARISSSDDADESEAGPTQQAPRVPERLRPDESEELELPEVASLTTADERWRAVVELLRRTHAPVAMACEHAYVEVFADEQVQLSFEEGFADLAGEEQRIEVVRQAVKTLFGEGWKVEMRRLSGDEEVATTNLAKEREEDILRRRAELTEQLRKNPTVQAAREIFGAEEPRISVKLFDE